MPRATLFLLLSVFLAFSLPARGGRFRIINGKPATQDQLYGTVALVAAGTTEEFCTGVLIAPKVVLTAAHCFLGGSNPAAIEVIAGVLQTKDATAAHRFTVKKIAANTGFKPNDFPVDPEFAAIGMGKADDIALLVTETAITTVAVVPILPSDQILAAYPKDGPLIITGYGTRQPNGQGDANTLYIATTVFRDKTATELWAGKSSSTVACKEDKDCPTGEVCLADKCFATDTCQGDSGGPIYVMVNNTLYVSGVVSRGTGTQVDCGGGGIYTRADAYVAWITSNADGNYGDVPVSDATTPGADAITDDAVTTADAATSDAVTSDSTATTSDLSSPKGDPNNTIPANYTPPPTHTWVGKQSNCSMGGRPDGESAALLLLLLLGWCLFRRPRESGCRAGD